MFLIYKISSYLLLPIFFLILCFRIIFKKETLESLYQKMFPQKNSNFENESCIWFHAASIGEALSIFPIINDIKKKRENIFILITTNTLSSAKIVREKIKNYKDIDHKFFPLDNPTIIRKFLNIWRPKLAIFVDSEIWPNFLSILKEKNTKLILLNARITNKTLNRWRYVKFSAKIIFNCFDLCLPCSNESERNLKQIGVKKIKYIGNIKFSQDYDFKKYDRIDKTIMSQSKFWCAASIHDGEDEFVLNTHLKLREKFKNLITFIIPRHIINTQKIYKKSISKGFNSQILKKDDVVLKNREIIIVNSFGLLSEFFNYCENVFIGKSLMNKFEKDGGQNPIEAAKNGCKIFYGPNVSNFTEIYKYLDNLQISKEIKNDNDLVKYLTKNLESSEPKNFKNIEILNQNGNDILNKTLNELYRFI